MFNFSKLMVAPLLLLALVIGFGCGNSAENGSTDAKGLSFFIGQKSDKLASRLHDHGFSPEMVDLNTKSGQLVQALLGTQSDDFLVVVNPELNKAITTAVITEDAQWSQVEQLIENLEKVNKSAPDQVTRLKPSVTGKARLVVFSDFQCPFCRKIEGVVDQWKQKYGNKLEVEFVNFPLPSHPLSNVAAVASICAKEQNKFDAYKAALFSKQEEMAKGKKPFFDIAKSLRLDENKFKACVSSKPALDKVQNDVFFGNYMAVKGTPTLFLNGEALDSMTVAQVEEKIGKATGN